jgi:hypothetical protein
MKNYTPIRKHIAISALLCFALIAASVIPATLSGAADSYAAQPKSAAGKAYDGVDLSSKTGLLSSNAYIYYGTYKHVTAVNTDAAGNYTAKTREETATPILWRVVGEEQASNGKGDGYITTFSQYSLDVKPFRTADSGIDAAVNSDPTSGAIQALPANQDVKTPGHTESKQYANSAIQTFLNGTFLKSFSAAEKARIPAVTVQTNTYRLGERGSNGLEIAIPYTLHAIRWGTRDTVFTFGSSAAAKQQVYLPWYTSTDDENAYTNPALFNGDYQESLFYSANGTIAANDAVNKNNAVYRRPAGGATESSALKGGSALLSWHTRTPCPGYHGYGNVAVFGADGYNSADSHAAFGVKPVFKIDPKSIVFASKITAKKGTGATKANKNYKAITAADVAAPAGAPAPQAYKLTVLTKDNKVAIKTLTLKSKKLKGNGKEKISVKGGKSVKLAATVKGADKLAYKIVQKTTSGRKIVGYGTGTKKAITITAKKNYGVAKASNLKKGSYTLYVWAQDDQATNSNVASAVKTIKLTVK